MQEEETADSHTGDISPHSLINISDAHNCCDAKWENQDNSLFSIFASLCCFVAPPLPSHVSIESLSSSPRATKSPSKHETRRSSEGTSATVQHKKNSKQILAEQMQLTAIQTAYSYLGLPLDKTVSNEGLSMAYPRWEPSSSSSTTAMPVFACETTASNGFKGVKYECVIYADKQQVFDFLISDEKAVESDANLMGFELLDQLDDHSAVRRYYYASYWVVSPRDFILYTTWRALKDGSLLICTYSPPADKKKYPPVKGYVRASILCSCSLIRDHKVNGVKCSKLTMVNHSVVGGSLSASVVNPMTEGYPAKYVTKLKRILETTTEHK